MPGVHLNSSVDCRECYLFGGLAAVAMRKFGGKNVADNHSESAPTKEDCHD